MTPSTTDLKFITDTVIAHGTTTGTREHLAQHPSRFEDAGVTAVLYQPGSSDIPRELAVFP